MVVRVSAQSTYHIAPLQIDDERFLSLETTHTVDNTEALRQSVLDIKKWVTDLTT